MQSAKKRFAGKKGFTLVELVIVIAILGILAAIAIPAVVGIINNAQKSAREANASELTTAAKNLYSGVKSGQINFESPQDELNQLDPQATAPKNATVEGKNAAANALTIEQTMQYAGLYNKIKDAVGDYVYDNTDGTIYYKDTYTGENGSPLELSTTLGELMGAS